MKERYGEGWSVETLTNCRKLFNVYSTKSCTADTKSQEIVTTGHDLPKDANIYAQQYALCLPDKQLLQQKLREWIAEFEEINEQEEDI